MTDFHDKPCHSKSDLVGDPNKPQEGSRKTSFAFVSDKVKYVRDHLGAGKHPSPLEKKKKKKKKKKIEKKIVLITT